ncbi:Variable outer membrane protein (plasmid) [Borrelia nietonii YOR]|uniref:Variable outer membrane protein n=1 Tax=Borrelia nietonii YOR TaxID=1293576 RepID=W5SBQ8_9SPIR|nr:Variable outer membrane protein [Borrelia nietonii YOR]
MVIAAKLAKSNDGNVGAAPKDETIAGAIALRAYWGLRMVSLLILVMLMLKELLLLRLKEQQ